MKFELAATVFRVHPPMSVSNGRELLEALIHDCAQSSQDQLTIIGKHRKNLVLTTRGQKTFGSSGLHRFLDLRFTLLWPKSDSPGIEVCGGNCFAVNQDTQTSSLVPISPSEVYMQFPEASDWMGIVSDISLSAHIQAISAWFRAAKRAGWSPVRMDLDRIPHQECFIRSGRGTQPLEEPFKSIILTRKPVYSPRQINLRVISTTKDTRVTESLQGAFHRWWKSLSISVRYAGIDQQPLVDPPEVGLLVIPDDCDIQESPWIDWLRSSEAKGSLFKIMRHSTLRSSEALTNVTFDLFMLAGGIPWTAVIGEEETTVLGLDAGHNRDQRWSRWVCAQIDTAINSVTCNVVRTKLAEHIPVTAIERLLPKGRVAKELTIFRDGRFHGASRREISSNGMIVSVAKHPNAVVYRKWGARALPAEFGDALRYPDGRVLLQTSSNTSNAKAWKLPVRLSVEQPNQVERAVRLTTMLCRQPALGVYSQPRLPVPIYWADLVSKTTSAGWPKVVGRGLGLESIIP